MSLTSKYGKWKTRLFIGILFFLCLFETSQLLARSDVKEPSAQPRGYFDYKGVIHWHTDYSKDCTGTYEQAAAIGNRQQVDFMIATEHNSLQALADGKEGWHANTLILTGVEITRPGEKHNSYLLGLDLKHYANTRADSTGKVVSDIAAQGGLALIAHPRNPRWSWTGPIDPRIAGMEILDMTDQWYTVSPGAFLQGLMKYPFDRLAAYLQLYSRPEKTLKAWDLITRDRDFVGVYAPDFHQSILLPGGGRLRFPRVRDVLPIAHDHIISKTPFSGKLARDKAMLYDAIRRGHLYVAIDMVQDATGFLFSATQGKKSAWMGDRLPAGRDTSFSIHLPEHPGLKNVVTRVYHDGEEIFTSSDDVSRFQARLPGAYRVEVETEVSGFMGLGKKLVWIYSNPIYLR